MGRNSKDNSLSRFEELIRISVRYRDYLRHPRMKIRFASGGETVPLPDAVHYVKNVQKTLSTMTPAMRELIEKEFFSRNTKPNWWSKYYSKSTYYRLRNRAIKKFVEAFDA